MLMFLLKYYKIFCLLKGEWDLHIEVQEQQQDQKSKQI